MIRTAKVIFCDNEHGTGEVTYPDMSEITDQVFVAGIPIPALRKQAKAAGWTRHNGADYCPGCSE